MKKFIGLTLTIAAWLLSREGDLSAQQLHYTTLSGYCEDAEPSDSTDCENHYYYRYVRDWQPDPVAEELYEDASWPGRRDDELSDLLSR